MMLDWIGPNIFNTTTKNKMSQPGKRVHPKFCSALKTILVDSSLGKALHNMQYSVKRGEHGNQTNET